MKIIDTHKHLYFSSIYFFGYAAYATFALDFIFYSEKIGFSNTEIGLIYAFKILMGILFQPLFGLVCDYLKSTRKMLLTMGAAAFVLSAALPPASSELLMSKLLILIIDFSYTFAVCAFMPLVDNWVVSEYMDDKRFHFGSLRLWGAVGYGIAALYYGRMTMSMDVANIYYGRAILFVIATLFIFVNRHESKTYNKTEQQENPDVRALLIKKEYWLFFIFLFVFCFPVNAAGAFFPRLLLERGSTNQTIGLISSINAFIEIPFFLYVGKLTRKIGSRGLILLGAFFMAVRILGFASADSIPVLLVFSLCSAPYFSFFMAGLIFYSHNLAPKNTRAFALTSLQGFAMGIAGTLGSYFGGMIVDSRGIRSLYSYGAVMCGLGIVMFIVTSAWLRKHRVVGN